MDIYKIIEKIKLIYGDQSNQIVYWLLEKLLGKTQSQIMLQKDLDLSQEQQKVLESWLYQIVEEHKPYQYVLGNIPFLDLDILLQPPILIPRLETEYWVDLLIQNFAHLKNEQLRILDMCSGSGCIALSLANFFKNSHVVAVDVSKEACALIKKNIIHNKLENVQVIESDLFAHFLREASVSVKSLPDAQDDRVEFDLIVSNPPYVPSSAYQSLDKSVRMWEDRKALVAPNSDLSIVEKIILEAPKYLRHRYDSLPQLWLEVDETQVGDVSKFMQKKFKTSKILNDQFDRGRVVIGK